MISALRGEVAAVNANHLLLRIPFATLQVYCPLSTLSQIKAADQVELFT